MSTSKLASFSFAPSPSNDKLFRKHKFTHHMISPFDNYKSQLSSNLSQLKTNYPKADPDYIKSLLEELENNVQMVSDILEEQHKKLPKTSMEQERIQVEVSALSLSKDKTDPLKPQDPPKVQELKTLRNSINKLFQKYKQQKSQKDELARKLAILMKENQNLKLMNRQLMNEQMQGPQLTDNQDIF